MQCFSREFNGQIWLEVFLVSDMNDDGESIQKIAKFANPLNADRIQLNTAVRPTCEAHVKPVPATTLQKSTGFFIPHAETIAEFNTESSREYQADEAQVLNMILRRPCTLEQVCAAFGMHRNTASKYLGKLMRSGKIVQEDLLPAGQSRAVAYRRPRQQ